MKKDERKEVCFNRKKINEKRIEKLKEGK